MLGQAPGPDGGFLGLSQQGCEFDPSRDGYDQNGYGPNGYLQYGYQPAPDVPTIPSNNPGGSYPTSYLQPTLFNHPFNSTPALDLALEHDSEQVKTPGQPYELSGYQGTALFQIDQTAESHQPQWTSQPTYDPPPDFTFSAPSFTQQSSTISPSQLGRNSMLKPTKTFSDLMMETRGSASSASSTEGGQEGAGNTLEDRNRMMPRAAIPDSSLQQSTATESPAPVFEPASGAPVEIPAVAWYKSELRNVPDNLESAVKQYISTANRLAFGERKIIIMTPKVGQKSYGTEKRFLCPHPQATLAGRGWWSKSKDNCPFSPILPPRLNISLAGEQSVKDTTVSWMTIDGKDLDEKIKIQGISPSDNPFLGNTAGKNLHITDSDGKRREAKAIITVKAPFEPHAGPNGWGLAKGTVSDISTEEVIGTFESKEIKVISKPSKKKANSKMGERESQSTQGIAHASPHTTRYYGCAI